MARRTPPVTDFLSKLAPELLSQIAEEIRKDSKEGAVALKQASSVSKYLREVCLPIMFRTFKFTFSKKGLDTLKQVSRSPLRTVVRVLQYEAIGWVDPLFVDEARYMTEFYEDFEANDMLERVYERTGNDSNWLYEPGNEERFGDFHEECLNAVVTKLEDEQRFRRRRGDFRLLEKALARFPNLNGFELLCTAQEATNLFGRFTAEVPDVLGFDAVFGFSCSHRALIASLLGLRIAKISRVGLKSFKTRGLELHRVEEPNDAALVEAEMFNDTFNGLQEMRLDYCLDHDRESQQQAVDCFGPMIQSAASTLKILALSTTRRNRDCVAMENTLHMALPALHTLELSNIRFKPATFLDLIEKHTPKLRVLKMKDVDFDLPGIRHSDLRSETWDSPEVLRALKAVGSKARLHVVEVALEGLRGVGMTVGPLVMKDTTFHVDLMLGVADYAE